ncbi:tRNA 2-selenouridine(34) synthase MnmH [Nautilia lithotrophica]
MQTITLEEFLKEDFDYILDARSPKEFEESHIPGARNFYVLNNEQHAYIGDMYKNFSKVQAKKEAVCFMLENISKQLKNFNAKPGSKILVYCARGGKRSTALYTILSQLDYVVYKLEGGYKAYRKWVVDYLQNFPHKKFAVLRGNSGCGKSELLEHLCPSLDLEKLANHFGSNFGCKGKQPTQKQFENEIAMFLYKTDPQKVIYIEAESPKIGKLFIPKLLHKRMQEGVQIEITANLKDRIKRILDYYGHIDQKEFLTNLEKIKPFISKKIYSGLIESYDSGNLEKVAEILLVEYYDKKYRKKESDFIVKNDDLKKCAQKIKSFVESIIKPSDG